MNATGNGNTNGRAVATSANKLRLLWSMAFLAPSKISTNARSGNIDDPINRLHDP